MGCNLSPSSLRRSPPSGILTMRSSGVATC
jgi:hypothetical protein